MKICVTGAEGFIGKNLCKHLNDMNYEVTMFEYASTLFLTPACMIG